MKKIIKDMYELAYDTVYKNRDLVGDRSVACSVVATKDGKMYVGVNVPWWHSVCAEPVATGNARAHQERELAYCITVKYLKVVHEIEVVTPCGICRQMFAEMYPNIKIIYGKYPDLKEYTIDELLPMK